MRYTVMLQWDAASDGYGVIVPVLSSCFTQGATVPEARERAREAIEGHVATLIDLGEAVPVEQDPEIVTSVEAQVRVPVCASQMSL